MKRIQILTALLLATVATSSAQIANWVVSPEYEAIRLRDNGMLEVSKNNKTGLMDGGGKEFLKIAYDSIGDFNSGHALLFNDSKMVGFVNTEGNVVETDSEFEPVKDMEFFSEGFLPVKKGHYFYYLNTIGEQVAGPFAEVRPYFNGFAAVRVYEDIQKNTKDTYLSYINSEQHLSRAEGLDKNDDISFISSFRDGQAVCVYKRKAYFVSKDMTSAPIITDSLSPKKSIINFDKDYILAPVDGGYLMKAKTAYLYFNDAMQLDKIETVGTILYAYKEPARDVKERVCDIVAFGEKGSMGVKYKDEVVLPQQFGEVVPLDGEYAAVEKDDKWGIIRLDTENSPVFKLNNNEHIGFNHRYFTAKLSASLPSYLKANDATIISKSDNCEIQVESRHENNNVERNTLTYDCRLAIPEQLSDTLSMHDYIYALKYNGFTSVDYKVTIPQWYVKYYEVQLPNTQFTLTPKDTISVEFDLVKTDAARNDDTNYFKTVELVTPEAEGIQLSKITENHYSFRVGGVNRDKLSFIVRITEVGCPPIEYPFEMAFSNPAPASGKQATSVVVSPILKATKALVPGEIASAEGEEATVEPVTAPDASKPLEVQPQELPVNIAD